MQKKGTGRKKNAKKSGLYKEQLNQLKLNLPQPRADDLSNFTLKGALEAIIFAAGDPVPAAKIAGILGISLKQVVILAGELMSEYSNDERGVMIGEVAGGYQMFTKPIYANAVSKIAEKKEAKLSPAALETLAVIAFKQPVTRLEIENIRGVKVDGIVNMLLERMLIKEVGRKEVVGRPLLYATTEEFLLCFGIKNLDELPPLAGMLVDGENNVPG